MSNGTYKNQIVMVNSFKGGCGKTSIALSLCVTESIEYFKEIEKESDDLKDDKKRKRQIIYLDIDILGTAVEYSLYKNGRRPTYMDTEKGIENSTNVVEFNAESFERKEGILCKFTAMLLNPNARETTSYTSNITARKNSGSVDKVLLDKLVTFLSNYVENNEDFFIVLDCSPGFNDFEKSLIEEIHKIKKGCKKNNFDFIECYVTTLDKSHIQKTISSLCNVILCKVNLDERNIGVIINDLTNLKNWDTKMDGIEGIEPESYLEELCVYVKQRFKSQSKNDTENQIVEEKFFVICNSYQEKISECNLMFSRMKNITDDKLSNLCLENTPDAYTNNKLREGVLYHGKQRRNRIKR